MPHHDTFRVQLAISHPDFGHALWDTSPGEQYPPVEIGDVGFIRQGKFHRLFNATYSENHPCNQRFGVPEGHERLPPAPNNIDCGTLSPNNFCSYGVTATNNGSNALAAGPPAPGSAEASFSCTRKHGAVLSLPVAAQREDTLSLARFRKWITGHIDSWFDFSEGLELGIEMEDIVLVTGYHRTRSSSNIVFYESQVNAQVSWGVQGPGAIGTTVNWQVSSQYTRGMMVNHGPSGENLPENQCLFIRGFRVERTSRIFSKIRAEMEPMLDPSGDDDEMETKVVSILGDTDSEYRDPLHVMLEYIAERAPHCEFAVVHDNDLERIMGVGDLTTLESLQPAEVMDYLRRSNLEIGVMSDSWPANNQGPRQNKEHMTVAMLQSSSEQLRSLDQPSLVPLLSHSSVGTIIREEIVQDDAPNPSSELTPSATSRVTVSEPQHEDRTYDVTFAHLDTHSRNVHSSGYLPRHERTDYPTQARSHYGNEKQAVSLPPSPLPPVQSTYHVSGDASTSSLRTASDAVSLPPSPLPSSRSTYRAKGSASTSSLRTASESLQQGMGRHTPTPYSSTHYDVQPTVNQPSPLSPIPQSLPIPNSSYNPPTILDAALKAYERRTIQNLIAHPLTTRLVQACDSPEAILAKLRSQVAKFGSSWGGHEKLSVTSPSCHCYLCIFCDARRGS